MYIQEFEEFRRCEKVQPRFPVSFEKEVGEVVGS
jgi:hypothetical protein